MPIIDGRNKNNIYRAQQAREYAYNAKQYRGNQVSGVKNGVAQIGFDKDGIYYENPYTLDEVTVAAPDLRVAKVARDRQGAAGLGQFAAASAFGPAGLLATLGANALDHYVMLPTTGQDWGSWMADKTGTAGGQLLGQPSEFWWGFTNPAGFVGGAALGASGNVFKGNGGKGSYAHKYLPLSDNISYFKHYTPKDYKNQVKQHSRFKIGDVEIDDPNLNYRQGNGIIEDLRKTGTVRVLPPKNGQSKHAILRKTFEQPMFEQGKLWYGLKAVGDKPEVLVTRESLQSATKYATPNKLIFDEYVDPNADFGRRIPMYSGQLNLNNTAAYRYVPGYGYLQEYPIKETPLYFYYYDRFKTK